MMKRLLAMTTATIVFGLGSAAHAATNLPGGLDYPVCDRAHSDQCLQLGQNTSVDRQLFRAYPQCEKMKGKLERGACINDAAGVTNQ
ncbi:MAG TPA: hypothetical protein VGZ72_16025 [Stellaceae bacterium]|jgi:hypothetical protein|nr:hypothetical protein [Stellaceae bacterium]